MVVDIEEVVSRAKKYLENRNHNKCWCWSDEIIALLEAGATPININEELGEKRYFHRVSYKNIIFTNSTGTPVLELERYSKNK